MSVKTQLVSTDQYPLGNGDPCVWVNPLWVEAVARLMNLTANYVVCAKNDAILGVLPIYEKNYLLMHRAVTTYFGYYQPLIFDLSERKYPNRLLLDKLEICSALARFLREKYARISINLSPDLTDVRGFTWNKIHAHPLYTFQHELSSRMEIFSEEKTNLRKALRQEYRGGFLFDPDVLIQLLNDMYKRKEMDLNLDNARLRTFLINMHEAGLIRQYNLFLDDQIVSANLLVCGSSDTVYTLIRATRQDELKKGVSVLHSELLIQELKSEYRVIDWCGANSPGPARFKAGLGFELKPFYRLRV